jgi:hypothetical protein
MSNKAVQVDLDALWKKLGIELQNGKVTFNDKAPEAHIRRAITAARTKPQ